MSQKGISDPRPWKRGPGGLAELKPLPCVGRSQYGRVVSFVFLVRQSFPLRRCSSYLQVRSTRPVRAVFCRLHSKLLPERRRARLSKNQAS